jgi:hypothetical protein
VETNNYLFDSGKPILPIIRKSYYFPFHTQIKNVNIQTNNYELYTINQPIQPTPLPVTSVQGRETPATNTENIEDFYQNTQKYPKNPSTYRLHAGLEGKDHVIILVVEIFPVIYYPQENTLEIARDIDIEITYELPKNPVVFQDEYDMVIIAPRKFTLALNPLIEHKNNMGIETTLKTTESIYEEYSGRDQPEKIKYFIKDAIETWNISYVLLCGGKKSLLFGNWGMEGPYQPDDSLWEVPVRYNTLLDSTGEAGCLTDLYFADIYKIEGSTPVFDDWDSDENNIFAQWTLHYKDILDLYPDVYVGRLACRNILEVKILVNKIITYESTPADPSWFKKIVGIGGDSFDDAPPLGSDYFEGEERNKLAAQYLGDFAPTWCWASHKGTSGLIPSVRDILSSINSGCGFLYFAGHGSTALYRTYWYHDWHHANATESFDIYQMMRLRNGKELPICVVGACHNSEYNVSFFNYLTSSLDYYPTPECWSWTLTRKIGGGSIATIGYTGLEWVATWGWDTDDIPDCTQYFSGYLDSRFFHAYGVDGVEYLGEACGQAITEYLNKFPGMMQKWDAKTPQQWHLLGDPSLRIGGYP